MSGRDRPLWRSLVSLGAVAWMILALPKPAMPYGVALVGAVFAWAAWKVRRDMKRELEEEEEERDDAR